MSNNSKKQDNLDPDTEKKSRVVIQRYARRLQVLKKAQEFSQKDSIVEAIKYYHDYLDILAKYHDTREENLAPQLFDHKQELAEIFLISHVYWDLAKAYDRSVRLSKESERCLKQFVKFTINFKFQYINSELIKKFLKKQAAHNPKNFERAYHEIRLNSKQCFIASYCFPEGHEVLLTLRLFKLQILNQSRWGDLFIAQYYSYSPKLVAWCERCPQLGALLSTISFRPLLFLLAKVIKKFIL